MQALEAVPFDFEGKEYEVRVTTDGMKIVVQAYHKGEPANGYTYQVAFTTAIDLKRQIGLEAIQHLIHIAQDDVKERRWEKYLEAVRLLADKGNIENA